MTLSTFSQKLSSIKEAPSVSGRARYLNIRVENDTLFFTRESTAKEETLDMNALFEAYKNEAFLNTLILRKYIAQRRYSPALAILIQAGLYNTNGNRN